MELTNNSSGELEKMCPHYYLERKSTEEESQVVTLGSFSLNTFYPTMPYEVFKILIQENDFIIRDEFGGTYTIESFKDIINNTYTNAPPVISLNTMKDQIVE
ncbi:MAG: hypothetical protein ACFFAJ_18995 [Candidatus Hodarchaeota archaeon]